MLKITYLESDIVLEQLSTTLETVVGQRAVLALRVGQPIVVQQSYGSFLLPAQLPGLSSFLAAVADEAGLTTTRCDRDWLEVTVQGIWMAEPSADEEGILVTELSAGVEGQLLALWRCSLTWATASQSLPKAC